MSDPSTLWTTLSFTVVGMPALLVAVLGLPSLLGRPLDERTTSRLVEAAISVGLTAAIVVLGLMLFQGVRHVPFDLGNWVHLPGFHFSVKFEFDRLSIPFVMLTFVLCGTIGAFASRYMHREPGYNRFFVLFALFVLGMVITSLAGTIETLFAGWELVGISSAMLVAFFHERPAPVRNGLRVWCVYRISDAALLIAAILLHHLTGEGDFDKLMGSGPWPEGRAALNQSQALSVGLLLLVAAAGKSALAPFSGWLPRAMEGPTPSSAVFYGALSVHLGAFLLLRISPILDSSPWLRGAVVLLGLWTAVIATLSGRAATDIKTALSFASLTQVSIIIAEIGLGLNYVALIHIVGHACLRTLQFLRAPSLMADYHSLENAIGARLPRADGPQFVGKPSAVKIWLYRFALERGYLDAWLNDYIARPLLTLFQTFDRLERRWTDWLTGTLSRESDRLPPTGTHEEEWL